MTPGTGTYKGTARYGQTLTTVFDGTTEVGASANFGHVLTGKFTDSSGVGHTTMPAPATEGGAVTLTAEWEGDTFEINFNYVGRPDVLTALQEAGIDADWSDFGSATIRISLTYGEEALLPEITGLRGIGYNWSDKIYCAVKGDLASPEMYSNRGNVELVWEDRGTGTEEDPIMVYDVQGLQDMSSADGFKYYRLGANLDLARWSFTPSSGTIHLDGGNHSISNVTINASYEGFEVSGLFKSLYNSTVKNLTLKGVSITGSMAQTVGILAGEVTGNVTITGVTVTESSIGITETLEGNVYYVGGLVGCVAEGAALTLTNCDVRNITDLSDDGDTVYKGGFVGYVLDSGIVNYDEGSCDWDGSNDWPEIGGPASEGGENTESGEMPNTLPEGGKNNASTDDSSNTEDIGDGDSATGEPTEPTDPGTDDATPPPEGETGEPGTDPGEETDASDPEQDNSEGGNPSSGDPVEPLA